MASGQRKGSSTAGARSVIAASNVPVWISSLAAVVVSFLTLGRGYVKERAERRRKAKEAAEAEELGLGELQLRNWKEIMDAQRQLLIQHEKRMAGQETKINSLEDALSECEAGRQTLALEMATVRYELNHLKGKLP